MKILKRGIVTKESDDGTFMLGDHIIFYGDGAIGCVEAGGWISIEDVEEASKGMGWEIGNKYIQRMVKELQEAGTK